MANIKSELFYGVININDEKFDENLFNLVKEYGIVVIKNVIPEQTCDNYVQTIVEELVKISDFDKKHISTWKYHNLPQQVRPGMFHEVICNTPTVNEIRFNKNIRKIFKTYYSSHHNKKYKDTDMVVSHDGINIKPGTVGPYHTKNTRDWPHLDQFDDYENIYKCIQGQMVLTNTTAGFRASPKSHLLFPKYSTKYTVRTKSGFTKFVPEYYPVMREQLEAIGGKWQIPIVAEKGDFIIWTSSTVHSAFLQSKMELPTKYDKWRGWRCVIYICYRPRDEYTVHQLEEKYKSFLENRVTDHWGVKTFPSGFGKWRKKKHEFSEELQNYIQNPQLVYSIEGMKPVITPDQKIMLGKTN